MRGSDPTPLLIYGAGGFTGELIAREAVRQGLTPVLAGRSRESYDLLAGELGLPSREFPLDDPVKLDEGLEGIAVVIHAAGPFCRTSKPMAKACLRKRVHYLDITGEVAVFEALAARDGEARSAGIMLLPGTGFDVVPTDGLAAHLKRRLPSATRLTLGFQAIGRASRGTLTTMVENIGGGGLVRRGGKLTPVPAAWKTRAIDFGRGPVKATTIPWGDLATAWRSTGIPDIEVYMAIPASSRVFLRATRWLGPLLATRPMQRLLKARIAKLPPGPSEARRAKDASYVWGEVEDDAGRRAVSRLKTPEGYTLTALASIAIAQRVLAGEITPGFQTPSLAYGADFVLGIEGVTRTDEP